MRAKSYPHPSLSATPIHYLAPINKWDRSSQGSSITFDLFCNIIIRLLCTKHPISVLFLAPFQPGSCALHTLETTAISLSKDLFQISESAHHFHPWPASCLQLCWPCFSSCRPMTFTVLLSRFVFSNHSLCMSFGGATDFPWLCAWCPCLPLTSGCSHP